MEGYWAANHRQASRRIIAYIIKSQDMIWRTTSPSKIKLKPGSTKGSSTWAAPASIRRNLTGGIHIPGAGNGAS
ncbi:hypothetical protein Taro_039080 [Colocasia esculenta]|uniref:Uncharacterized protein n=1 Tax=Colocasia esculenta TaxID=4460 RepID=A0A843W9Q6_COLES|nr:hypothetical protein [Colocasia esculenta]